MAVKLRIREFIRTVNEEQGTTIILTTHDLSDVEAVCDRVLLIDHGSLLFDGDIAALKSRLGGQRRLIIELPAPPDSPAALTAGLPAEADLSGTRLTLAFAAEQTTAAALIREILGRTEVVDLSVEEPDIDAVVARFYEGLG